MKQLNTATTIGTHSIYENYPPLEENLTHKQITQAPSEFAMLIWAQLGKNYVLPSAKRCYPADAAGCFFTSVFTEEKKTQIFILPLRQIQPWVERQRARSFKKDICLLLSLPLIELPMPCWNATTTLWFSSMVNSDGHSLLDIDILKHAAACVSGGLWRGKSDFGKIV